MKIRLVLILIVLMMLAGTAGACTITGTPYNTTEATVLKNDTVWNSCTFEHIGNITVASGNLTLINTSISFNGTGVPDSGYGFLVNSKMLYINNSILTSTNISNHTWFWIQVTGDVTTPGGIQINNSNLSRLGQISNTVSGRTGIMIREFGDKDTWIKNSKFTGCYTCIFLLSSDNVVIENNTFINISINETSPSTTAATDEVAIQLYFSENNIIKNNTFTNGRMAFYSNVGINFTINNNTADNIYWYTWDMWGNNTNSIISNLLVNYSRIPLTFNKYNSNITVKDIVLTNTRFGANCGGAGSATYINWNISFNNFSCTNSATGSISSYKDSDITFKNFYLIEVGYDEGNTDHSMSAALSVGGINTTFDDYYATASTTRNDAAHAANAKNFGIYAAYSDLGTARYVNGSNVTVTNVSVSGFYDGVRIMNQSNTILRDVNISGTTLGYDVHLMGSNSNIKFINLYYNMSSISLSSSDKFENYVYADINVTNSSGSPINNATITFTNNVNSSYPSINRLGITTSLYTTDASGHTPLPIGNDSTTVVLMNWSKNSTSQENMSYTISVCAENYTCKNATTTSPLSSWYRSSPNTYQNTTTIILLESPVTPSNPASAYTISTCQSTLGWGQTGSALLIVLIIIIAGGLAFGFMSGTLKMDTFPIQEFAFTLVAVVVIGSIGVAIINPIIIAVGCP